MRLFQIHENIQSSNKIWYHGSPDTREVDQDGLTKRTNHVRFVADLDRYHALSKQLLQVPHASDEYMDILGQVPETMTHDTYPRPVYFTDKPAVANTYADDKRALDYQEAVPGVLKARVSVSNPLNFNARGKSFRGFTISDVQRELEANGIDREYADETLRKFMFHTYGGSGKVRSDNITDIAFYLGYDSVLFKNIVDTYMGDGMVSNTLAVFNLSNIQILGK